MTLINTTLNGVATRRGGQLEIPLDAGFASMAQLGLLLGMADPETRQLPTDLQGLKDAARRMDGLLEDCLDGLRGIGAVLGAARTEGLTENSLGGIGRLIENVAALAQAVSEGSGQLTRDPRFSEVLK